MFENDASLIELHLRKCFPDIQAELLDEEQYQLALLLISKVVPVKRRIRIGKAENEPPQDFTDEIPIGTCRDQLRM